MKQSTLDTIAGIIRALLFIVAIFIGKDLPVDAIINQLVPVIGGVWALFELIKGYFSNSDKMQK